MGSRWDAWDDMPPLVDASLSSQPPPNILPPAGATVMPGGPSPHPHSAPPNTQRYPWGTPFPQYVACSAHAPSPLRSSTDHARYTFPNPQSQDAYAAWHRHHDPLAYQQKSGPSPYIPRQPLHPEMPSQPSDSHPHHRRAPSMPDPTPNTHRPWNSVRKHFQWPTYGADLSPLQLPSGMPDIHLYAPRAPDMNTPSSSLSRTISENSPIPPGMYHERPQQWRHDFKFKSSFASMFRHRSNRARSVDDLVDSAKLDLHPVLRYSRSRPLTVYDLRRKPLTLIFRTLDRPPYADDMDHSVTHPATQYMRLYHARLPWYIDIRANGASYISLADFFQQVFAALSMPVSRNDYYNNELDDEDRDVLTRMYLDRCHNQEERMEGVKRVDFLRGKFEWMGLAPGKNGMWQLKTS